MLLALTLAGLLALIVALPLGDALRGQILSLVGVLLSATIALAATTFVGNAMAGVLLRVVRNFELGDFAVTYRVAGLLREVKQLLTGRSRLRVAVLDELHAAGIEIVSPAFMNSPALLTSSPLRGRSRESLRDLPPSGILSALRVRLRCPPSVSLVSPGAYDRSPGDPVGGAG